jgi:mRNA interferase HigB
MGACYNIIMRIIDKKRLSEFWELYPDAKGALEAWHDHAKRARWLTPADVQRDYGDDVILPDKRAVFNIKGNKYRLVVRFNYAAQSIYIRFINTHAEYDRINVMRI